MDRRLEQFLSRAPSQADDAAGAPTQRRCTPPKSGVRHLRPPTGLSRLEETQQQLEEARAGRERTRQELEETRVSLELLRNSRLIRATRRARMLYHRLRGT